MNCRVYVTLPQLFQSETVTSGGDVSHLLQLWTTFVNLPTPTLSESVVAFRKSILAHLSQILLLKVPTHDNNFYRNFLVPCLNFEAAILETDKVSILCNTVHHNGMSSGVVP